MTKEELEARAKTEPMDVLRLWLHDGSPKVRIAARDELKARGEPVPANVARSRFAAGKRRSL